MDIDHQVKIILIRIESEGNLKKKRRWDRAAGSLVKDKSLTHLLVTNASPSVETVKTSQESAS